MIDRNPTEIGQTLDGRDATYFGGTSMATWYWRAKAGDPAGVDGWRIEGGRLCAVRHAGNGYYSVSPTLNLERPVP